MTTTSAVGSATAEPVRFRGDQGTLAGELFLPVGAGDAGGLPAVFVTGTWTSIREQMANRYAAKLAERGVAALSFDFTGFGLSGGEPREVESPRLKASDMHAAVSFLAEHPAVDADRLGAVVICASAGYAVSAALGDERIRALALVAPWLHDAKLVREVYGGEEGIQDRLRAAAQARERYADTGVVDYVPVVDPDDPQAAMPMAIDFYMNSARGALPGWPNRFAVMSWKEWLEFDPIALAPQVNIPTLMVHSEDAAIPDGAKRFFAGLTCTKQDVWTEGDQFDFYDQEPTVSFAVEQAVAHLDRYL